jgi:glycosyltransferase involved in cell wall biosynthesis
MKRGITIHDKAGVADEIDASVHHLTVVGFSQPPSKTNVICWITVPTHANGWYEGQHRSIITMWEATRLPEDFRKTLHEFQTVIVPSPQNLELFSQFHDNVHLMLLGVDPTLWHYREPSEPHPAFNFLISGRGKRKGVDLAYEAFQTVFGKMWEWDDIGRVKYVGSLDKPAPRLIMKSLQGHGEYYAPGVDHVTGRLDPQVEADLYASAHCYLGPSRGEGFGLQPLQALAMGRPTILTNAHGHESYAHLGIPIDYSLVKAGDFMAGDAGQWWEPDFEQLCEAMWDVWNNYTPHLARAKESAAIIAKDWQWSNTADTFVDIMGDEMVKPYTGDGTWETPEQQLFRIRVLHDFTHSVAGRTRTFYAGKDYYDIAEIKRILFDGGKLDPECLEDADPGLAPNQLPEIDRYRALHEHCPTCGQPLNEQRTLSEKILAGEVSV